jgi:outer membrane protein assembly factor BamB
MLLFAVVGIGAVVAGCGGHAAPTSLIPDSLSAAPSDQDAALSPLRHRPTPTPSPAPPTPTPGVDVAFQLNVTHSGALSNEGIGLPLQMKWKETLAGAVGYPISAGGEVFLVGGVSLYALDATTGQIVWQKQQVQAPPQSYGGWAGVAYDSGIVFAVQRFVFSGSAIFAYNAKTGAEVWEAPLPGQYAFSSPPTAVNGVVYTGGAGSGGTVYALSESNGQLLWTQSVENGDDSSPAVASDGVYVSYACPQTYKLNLLSGAVLWHYAGPCEGGGGSTPVLYGNSLYVEDSYSLSNIFGTILQASTGVVTGTMNTDLPPAFANGIGYEVSGTSGHSEILAFNATSNAQLWTASPTAANDSFAMSPIVVDDVLYTVSVGGTLYALDATTGSQLQTLPLGAPASGSYGTSVGLGVAPGLVLVPDGTSIVAVAGASTPAPTPTPSPTPTKTPRPRHHHGDD